MQLVICTHCVFDDRDIIGAVRTKNKINKLIKRMMNIEKCGKSIEIMKELFDFEHDLSMLIISELKKQMPGAADFSSSSDSE